MIILADPLLVRRRRIPGILRSRNRHGLLGLTSAGSSPVSALG